MTPTAARYVALMFGLGGAVCIGGSLAHSMAAKILGATMGGISCLWWLAGLL